MAAPQARPRTRGTSRDQVRTGDDARTERASSVGAEAKPAIGAKGKRKRAPAKHSTKVPASAVGAAAVGTTAVGSLVLGAFALGAIAIGALAIGRLAIGRARIRRLEIDELIIHRQGER
jgi:hypothetical protein